MGEGPGALTTDAISKITNADYAKKSTYAAPADGKWDVITAKHNIPQTRANWDKVLQKYRKIVRSAISAPQS